MSILLIICKVCVRTNHVLHYLHLRKTCPHCWKVFAFVHCTAASFTFWQEKPIQPSYFLKCKWMKVQCGNSAHWQNEVPSRQEQLLPMLKIWRSVQVFQVVEMDIQEHVYKNWKTESIIIINYIYTALLFNIYDRVDI